MAKNFSNPDGSVIVVDDIRIDFSPCPGEQQVFSGPNFDLNYNLDLTEDVTTEAPTSTSTIATTSTEKVTTKFPPTTTMRPLPDICLKVECNFEQGMY